ncbi:MAG: glutamine--fructose-6-phosphate transaminase (isomerizing) [Bacteroides graminisolvens]|jgi:glutamine--fructose-6-phosphate transaminase|uniref:Glutamine--fructose-6-phosphate aminotransferase [isomerizing] n=1 Tax=Bacteroides graminisolvens DSM 19988 = JCM 15093 TaxID=1121097 RepID=A0A069D5I9_9BACE|nr:glutamine--fructose-6-phosphate transaminase (isomerizing) [Bacteroides graminisolvens]MBP6069676.1 glutamine--fructose-6-phosphate transaminase (isomerizing) [Bacteroides sp.]MBP6248904.1 glutamine--fructose-6-phosphate transaminase (isomerizing) [Bacteroides sp.]MBP6980682.1 glutamine--fructose-6-phosphate transaminase (isomerizing) [Bacteroides sp.]MBP7292680.1 glutamine--fructose-6-phosphate transaminase (isomerizing) [Bacteroides sp.]MBP9552693.1 glutamine--fructose-6-phosphate transam
MCGIVGYIGNKDAYPILIKGLKRLEYRGYDSAGVALINENQDLNVYKTKGKVSDLENFVVQKDISGNIGIAHTRWATHGEPCSENAHPHYSSSENLALIHNGIIENYASLKEKLQEKGYSFKSSTDTEVLVQLIEYIKISNNLDLLSAVQLALGEVIGAYAIAVLEKNHPDEIIAARKSSPLVVGIGQDEFFLASDATPIVEYTDKVVYLEDEEIALIRRHKDLKIVNLNNVEMLHQVKSVKLNLGQLEKGGYPHFMLKEIVEQPGCIHDCMRGRINIEGSNVVLSAVIDYKEKLLNAKRFIIVACGTSWHAGLIGKHLIESFCRIPVEVEYASEFRYRDPVINSDDVIIAISQSGETADTLAAIELAKSKGAFIYGICNAVGSSIPRATHTGSYIHVGPEIGVASTKAFTGQVTVLTMLALTLAKEKGTITQNDFLSIVKELNMIPEKMKKVLELNSKIAELSKIFTYAHNFIYLGRGYSYPVALEGALKLKEISYIHAEGYPAAEMKHGPIALIDAEMPVVVIATHNGLYEKVLSNIQEIKARKGKVIALVTEGDTYISNIADYCIELPETIECLDPLITTVPLQLLAYHIAVCKGMDVDQPRNLAKSVTVE